MEEQGKEVVREINRHQEGSQGHGRGHQQGNGMHNQVEISSHLIEIMRNKLVQDWIFTMLANRW